MAHYQRQSQHLPDKHRRLSGISQPKIKEGRPSLNSASLILFHVNRLSDDDQSKHQTASEARMDKILESLVKTVKYSGALVTRYGIDGFAVLLRSTGFHKAVQIVGSIARRLEHLGFTYSKTHPFVIQVGPASSLLLQMDTSMGPIARTNQQTSRDYVRSPEFECL